MANVGTLEVSDNGYIQHLEHRGCVATECLRVGTPGLGSRLSTY